MRFNLNCGLSTETFAECLYVLAGWPRLPSLMTVDQMEIWFSQMGSATAT